MNDSYIPGPEGLALTWMQTFAGGLTANAGVYQLSPADALTVQSAVNAYAATYATAMTPALRSPVNVNLKDNARNSAEQVCRQYASLIKFNAGISDADKIAIGVRPVNTSREPMPVPSTSPLVNIVAATPGSHTLRYADSNTPDTARKPFGVSNIQIYVAIAPTPTGDEGTATFYSAFTKNPIGVAFDNADDGKVATYFARWADPKGQVGPWSLPVSMRIAA